LYDVQDIVSARRYLFILIDRLLYWKVTPVFEVNIVTDTKALIGSKWSVDLHFEPVMLLITSGTMLLGLKSHRVDLNMKMALLRFSLRLE
jgi:hypothetical protein